MSLYLTNEIHQWKDEIDRAIIELQNEKGRITYDKVVEKIGNERPLPPSSEVNRYIIDSIKDNNKRNHTVQKVLNLIEEMIKNRQSISMCELSKKAGVTRTLLYEYKEIKERIEQYEKKDKIEIVKETIKELYEDKELITIQSLQNKTGMEKSFLSNHKQIRLWINEYNEQLRIDKYIEEVKRAIHQLKKKNKKVNISQVANEMGVYTSYLYRQPKVIDYIKKGKISERENRV
jgi:DNA-binding phage protein